MSNDTKTYSCPACGSSDYLATTEETVAWSYVTPAGEFSGETNYEGDLTTVGIECGACSWSRPCGSLEDGLRLLRCEIAAESTPEPDYWNDFPDLLADWRAEVANGDTLRSFPEYVEYRAEADAEEER